MLKNKIKEMLESSGIQYPAQWLIKSCGFSKTKAYKFVNNQQPSMSNKDLTRICENLNCTPNDIYYWSATAKPRLPENHPLITQLTPPDKTTNWFKLFKTMSPDKIALLQKMVIQDLDK